MQNQTFMINKLDIRSSVHRQKLRLNALDVVLFGHRDHSNRLKDIALALSVRYIFANKGNMARPLLIKNIMIKSLNSLGIILWKLFDFEKMQNSYFLAKISNFRKKRLAQIIVTWKLDRLLMIFWNATETCSFKISPFSRRKSFDLLFPF